MTVQTDTVVRASAVLFSNTTGQSVNVFHVKVIDDLSQTEAVLLAEIAEYIDEIYSKINTRVTDNLGYQSIEMFDVSANEPLPPEEWPVQTVGGSAASTLPEGVAALSIAPTRKSKTIGKKYWPVFTEDQLANGVWEASTVTNVQLAADVWIADFQKASGALYTPGLWNRVTSLFTPFVSSRTSQVPAYQRRRKRGVGS